MNVEDVRYREFERRLHTALIAAGGTLLIGLRIDGAATAPNIILRTENLHERQWRVLAAQHHRSRADTWNMVAMITNVVMRNKPLDVRPLPDHIQQAYEHCINNKQGWVVLHVEKWTPVKANWATTP